MTGSSGPREPASGNGLNVLGFVKTFVLPYALVGLGFGLCEFLHQASRDDPGFHPLFTGAIAGLIWPLYFYLLFVAIFRR